MTSRFAIEMPGMNMRLSQALPLFFMMLLCPLPTHAADKSQEVADRLKAVADLSSLDAPGVPAWHWKIDVTLWDKDGKNPQAGGIEVWSADGRMRSIESMGTAQIATIRTGDQIFRGDGESPSFAQLELMLQDELHPIPEEILRASTKLELSKDSVGKIELDCIIPTLLSPRTEVVIVGRRLSYCLKRDTNTLLVRYSPGDLAELRNQIGAFQSKEVPIDSKLFSGTVLRVEAKTVKLETYAPTPDEFTPPEGMRAFVGPVEVQPGDLIGTILSKTPPSYPTSAKQRHVSGSVKLDAIIGTDGHIVSLQPNGKSDGDLQQAALDSVHQWVYRPFWICGVPVQIKTIITVNFNLN